MSSRHNTGPREPEAAAETGRGVVKSVLSGDTFTIVRTDQRARNGPPPETELTLAMLEVPKLGRRNAEDEVRCARGRDALEWASLAGALVLPLTYARSRGRGSRASFFATS